jgi:elongation factor G
MLSRFFGQSLRRMNYFNFSSSRRNIGISAHIDSGKTTFTERVLFYSGRINQIHEVRGSDGVGATMDFMELEREKGITIQSAATHFDWNNVGFNLIDTPGHVDFTIEVERALRVLDGAIMIVCGVAGVQAQTYTVYKQMKRYDVPRIIFVNKLDRMGASPFNALTSIKNRLGINAELLQIPIGEDHAFIGVVDLIRMKAIYFEGESGMTLREDEIPPDMMELAIEKRNDLLGAIADFDEEIGEKFIMEEEVTEKEFKDAIRKATLELKFAPVFMGSAFKNKGVQLALDAAIDFLPSPEERVNKAFSKKKNKEEEITLTHSHKDKLVSLAFKLEENRFGQLTYIRVYQGSVKKGDMIFNVNEGKKVKVVRMIQMHADKMEDIDKAEAGDIFALFGTECSSGDTFINKEKEGMVSLSSMHVPDPVLSLTVIPKNKEGIDKLQKALKKFCREDPTFHFNVDHESEQLIISGMGELHLEIYAERLKREFEVPVEIGTPSVNYRETLVGKVEFNYLHKKQSGGAGQFARIIGYMEPIHDVYNQTEKMDIFVNEFKNKLSGMAIDPEYINAVEKEFYYLTNKGPLTQYPIINCRFVLQSGETHSVDSSANAFAIATRYAVRDVFKKNSEGMLLEPIMNVEVSCPAENYQPIMNSINKRKGSITNAETQGDLFLLSANVPLAQMFGFSTELRGFTQGQGEYSMEYKGHEPVAIEDLKMIQEKVKEMRKLN